MNGLLIAAPRSGSGKTSVTLAILAALRRRGMPVRAAKSGPDYIDPAFHAAATGRPTVNLDSWAMPPALLQALFADGAADGPLVVESAMGLFDGLRGPRGGRGSAADLCIRLGLPVLLVLDVSGQSQSAAAVAWGFAHFDPAVRVAGVILNRTGSERHRRQATEALEDACIAVLGALPRDPAIALPERHLGLVQAIEHGALPTLLDRLASLGEEHLDLDGILAIAAAAPSGDHLPAVLDGTPALPPPGQRVAIARDAAFSFLYEHLASGWRQAGAELRFFSPLADEAPPADSDACWLPGGYPELHAAPLAAADRFRAGMIAFAETRPVHGECGGFMVLGRSLADAGGVEHRMLGLLDHDTSFARRRMTLGYREATLLQPSVLGRPGDTLRGHEFHYATVSRAGDDAPLAMLADGNGEPLGPAGTRRGPVSGSFFHAIARRAGVDAGNEPGPA
ncbi:cobyrinate a,c-diamide synthase [Rhizosaccharibacter radicis]|uniref:Cobyrinate a,c-diamide synthase n=1 Tax=Rhizosaccharibacter radicis TaxID=2782605 RepID=A0ABT1VY63_9PROT|nr:cobyrinate a,c-diamide synthase [Acetobacteraceae bacterium KSS12]